MILEICTPNFESAVTAQKAGAHRIELCTELRVGGLTPSYGLLKEVIQHINLPVHVLIRPRSGNFTYSKAEWNAMLRDIDYCLELDVAGIVCGVLTDGFEVDISRTQELVTRCGAKKFTFHRAFDWVVKPMEACKQLQEIGVDRILSSGQQATALEGMDLLQKLMEQSKGVLEIMPGGGIDAASAPLFQQAGFSSIHASATQKTQSLSSPPKVPMEAQWEEGTITYASESQIRDILHALS